MRRSRSRWTADRSRHRRTRPSGRWPKRQGTTIPHLCHAPEPGYRADGNCRACMVEIEGERVLAASCVRKPVPDMVVRTPRTTARSARNMVMELLVADQPARERRTTRNRNSGRGPIPWASPTAAFHRATATRGDAATCNRRQPRCLHPLQSLRPGLPRGAGQ